MHTSTLVLIGFAAGVIFTMFFGNKIAADAKSDTAALINGVENRLHQRLDRFKVTVQKDVAKV